MRSYDGFLAGGDHAPRSDRAERALSGRRKAPSGQRREAPVRVSTVESASRAAVGEARMEPAASPSS